MQVGISVNLIFLVVGIVVSSAVPPLAFLLTWSKVPRGAAITSAIAGQVAGIIAWLAHTQIVYGVITQDTSQVTQHTSANVFCLLFHSHLSRLTVVSLSRIEDTSQARAVEACRVRRMGMCRVLSTLSPASLGTASTAKGAASSPPEKQGCAVGKAIPHADASWAAWTPGVSHLLIP